MVAAQDARFERAMASAGTTACEREGDAVSVPLVDRGTCPDSSLLITSRAALDQALVDAAVERGARLVPERVLDVVSSTDGVTIHTHVGTHRAGMVLWGRRGQQSGPSSLCHAVFASATLGRDRLLRARHFVARSRDSMGVESTWVFVVVPASRPPCGWRLRAG